ncbi:MAG: hypothetical protein CMJ77_18060 [Planctomycetaceae bacterium]|nr:hypothetical protein [Planctomycetaceae bacterium]
MSENQLDHEDGPQGHDSHNHEDHGGFKTYMFVFGGLIVLTIMSFWIGNSDLKNQSPAAAWAGMMAVSCGKAMLVILFFMHLKWEANWKYVLTIPAMMMSIFLVLMLVPDVGMRTRRYSEERIIHAAESASHSHEHGGEHDENNDHSENAAH